MSRLPKSRQRTRRSHSGASQPTLPARRVNQGGPARRADNDRGGTTITITSSDASHPHTTVAPHSADDPERSASAWQLCEAGVSTLPQHGPKAAVCRCLADCPNLAILRRGTEPRRASGLSSPSLVVVAGAANFRAPTSRISFERYSEITGRCPWSCRDVLQRACVILGSCGTLIRHADGHSGVLPSGLQGVEIAIMTASRSRDRR